MRVSAERFDGHEFLFVVRESSRYIRDDGWSFGVGDEQGHLYTAHCRPATPEEAAPVIQRIEEARQRDEAKRRVETIASSIKSDGEFPVGPVTPTGQRLFDTQNLYGGGSWFVIGADHIWYIMNNGADGDDWSRNNVGTGGAGAIGWRVEFSQPLADELRSLSSFLATEKH